MPRCVCGHDQADHIDDPDLTGDACVRCECASFDPTNDNADDPMSPEDFEDGRRIDCLTLPDPSRPLSYRRLVAALQRASLFGHACFKFDLDFFAEALGKDFERHCQAAIAYSEIYHAQILNTGFAPTHTERGRHGHHDEGRC